MKVKSSWPKRPVSWGKEGTLYISVPFTWNMPEVRASLRQSSFDYRRVVIGGPGVYLTLHYYPDFLAGVKVEVGNDYPGVLQIVNPQATRTTLSCVRQCRFCALGQGIIEPGGFRLLADWPDLPTIADNNLSAAPLWHFDRVIDRLKAHDSADFEQGLDPRLLTVHHATRLAELPHAIIRLALDNVASEDKWLEAFDMLLGAGVAKYRIRSYALIGFDSGPEEARSRCEWIEDHGVKALPMWFHRLDALEHNVVTEEQKALGWTDYKRRRIMQWFYQHKKAVA